MRPRRAPKPLRGRMISYIVTSFDHRETYWRDAEEQAMARAQDAYPRLVFEILEFADGERRTYSMTSFRYRRYASEAEADAARNIAAAGRPDKTFRVRMIFDRERKVQDQAAPI